MHHSLGENDWGRRGNVLSNGEDALIEELALAGKFQEAIDFASVVAGKRIEEFSLSPKRSFDCLVRLGELCEEVGRNRDAAAHFARASQGMAIADWLGPGHGTTVATLLRCADNLAMDGKGDQAAQVALQAYQSIDKTASPFFYVDVYSKDLVLASAELAVSSVTERLRQIQRDHIEAHFSDQPAILAGVYNAIASDLLNANAPKLASRAANTSRRYSLADLGDDHPQMQRAASIYRLARDSNDEVPKFMPLLSPDISDLLLLTGTSAEVIFRVAKTGGHTNLYFNSRPDHEHEDCVSVFVHAECIPFVQDLGVGDP